MLPTTSASNQHNSGASNNSTSNNNNNNTNVVVSNNSSPLLSSSSLPIRHINNGLPARHLPGGAAGFNSMSSGHNSNNPMNSSTTTNNASNLSNSMNQSTSTAAVPQYQQYFTMLQSMAASNSSSSTTLPNLPSTSSIMAMHGIPSSNSSSSVLRKTSFSAILAGNAPKSVNLQTLSSQIATPQSTIQAKKNNSPPSTSTAANIMNNNQMSPALGVISTQSAQNSLELVASGTVPSNLLESSNNVSSTTNNHSSSVSSVNMDLHTQDVVSNSVLLAPNSLKQTQDMRPVPVSNNLESASPVISTPKQTRKPRRKKGEETPSSVNTPNSSTDTASSPQETDEDSSLTPNAEKSSKGRSKTCKRWTEEQNRLLKEAVIKYGPRNWKKIAAEICGGIFTADQCNQHWHRVLHPRIIKGEWTPEEDNLLIEKVEEFGESSWTKVAEFLAGRTDIQCRHRYFQKKKENDTGRRKSVTSIGGSSPFMGGSTSSPSLGQGSSMTYDLSPMLGSSGNTTESTQAILNSALLSGVNFPSPALGISPSSILTGGVTNTSNFVHQHRVVPPLFSAPSTVPLQERLKGDSVVLGSSSTPTMNSSSSPFLSSNLNEIPPFPESKKKQNQYYYVEKSGLDESDFTPPLATTTSSPILGSSDSTPSMEKKDNTAKSTPNINENLLLCDEEDLSTPNIEKDLDSIKKKTLPTGNTPLMTKNSSSNAMITDDDDDMDEDEEEAQLTIDEMDTDKSNVSHSKPLLSSLQHSTANTPDVIKKEIPESPQLMNSPAVGASPSVVNEKPKKRSSALNRMRANINVWVPFSESEEIVLRREISKQMNQRSNTTSSSSSGNIPLITTHSNDPNAPKPIQVVSFNNPNEDFLDRIDFVSILRENTTSFHPLRTPISLKVHSQALRQELGDSVLTDINFKGETPQSLYEKSNSHSWLASSKNARSNQGSGGNASGNANENSKPRRRKNQHVDGSASGDITNNTSSGKPPVPGRKRKQNAPVSNSPAMAMQTNQISDSTGGSSSVSEPSQKKTKVEEAPQAANSTFLVLLLGKGAPKETRQIQPSKKCLPLETTLAEVVSKIREELSLDYDPQLICDFVPVQNYAQTLQELMEKNDIKINELLIQYK